MISSDATNDTASEITQGDIDLEQYYESGLNFIRWLQATYPQLDEPMAFISLLGGFEFYIVIVTLIYWCIHKQNGRTLAYLLLFSAAINTLGKAFLRLPRPFWLDSSVGLAEELSYGLPSGHTQIAVTLVFFLAGLSRRPIAWFFAILYALLMGMSRIYLGVHFVQDILAGAILGSVIVAGYWAWEQTYAARLRERIFGQRLFIAALFPLGLFLVYVVVMQRLGKADYTDAVVWSFLTDAENTGQDSVVRSLAALFGVGVGFLFEMNRVWFDVQGGISGRIIRWLIGLIFALAIWLGLEVVFEAIAPPDIRGITLTLRFVHYMLLGLWIAYFAPQLFVATGLAKRTAAPETPYSIKATRIRSENR